jgi:A/G-specific adenine glycosylase
MSEQRAPLPGEKADEGRPAFVQRLLDWYAVHQRDLPWRRTRDPYAILVAEVMLQQTQVERVIPKYHAFLARFPTLADLAAAPVAEVIRAWHGLGYNLRAVRLHRIARAAAARFGGELPSDYETLLTLDGIGPYTAAAVAAIAFGRDHLAPDTNVRRVLGRLLAGQDLPRGGAAEQALLGAAGALLPAGEAGAFNQALMDLGALVCTARAPRCLICPLRADCRYAAAPPPPPRRRAPTASHFVGSTRYYRGRVVAVLRGLPPGASVSVEELARMVRPEVDPRSDDWLAGLLGKLAAEGLVRVVREGRAGYQVGPEDRVALP